ncbi:uncharacterized protein LOC120144456 [Hibiscus syriacus]|uniref:uncharacterized protein LOC120144456 n=1 Tax=Hibiscus syriacus TaxID=106335 RepID=UPI001921EA32|nr:uncharacterized protein LOC120144456 [Hibiscus syriacus]
MITRHPHMISHSYSLQEDHFSDWRCRICYEEVDTRYGIYYCSACGCNYIAYLHCATNKAIWDGTIVLEDNDEICKETYTLENPCHEHSLFLVHESPMKCSGCCKVIAQGRVAYRSMKHCDFTLDIFWVTRPLTAWYKYDRHPLTLNYSDDSSPSQHYCDLCEDERNPNNWFYYCVDCDNSLHSGCALGSPQFMKLGSKVKYGNHPHPLTIVKNIWNWPPCKVCGNICNGLALECKESECNFTVHDWCRL